MAGRCGDFGGCARTEVAVCSRCGGDVLEQCGVTNAARTAAPLPGASLGFTCCCGAVAESMHTPAVLTRGEEARAVRRPLDTLQAIVGG